MKLELKLAEKSTFLGKKEYVYFTLLEDVAVYGYIIPAGFDTDFASVPQSLWNVLPPMGKHNEAALLHDWLYTNNIGTRKQADKLFLKIMLDAGVDKIKAYTMYLGVRIGGSKWWRKKGKVRIFK